MGVVLAREVIEVASQLEAYLTSVDVRVGDRVVRGARIATLEASQLQQELEMASADLKAAEAAERRATVEFQEVESRYARRASIEDLFSAEDLAALQAERQVAVAALEVARAQMARDHARFEQFTSRLARSVLRAPIHGRVALRYLDPGALVRPGMPVVRLISSEAFLFRFAVSPQEAGELRVGRPIEIWVETLDRRFPGVISHIAPQVDPASYMVFAEAALEIPAPWSGRLQHGLVGRVVLL